MKYLTITATLLALLIPSALLAICLAGCGEVREGILHPGAPTLYLLEAPVNSGYFRYFIFASEPLPYPISLRVSVNSKVRNVFQHLEVQHHLYVTFKRGTQLFTGIHPTRLPPSEPFTDDIQVLSWAEWRRVEHVEVVASFDPDLFTAEVPGLVSEITVEISHIPADMDDGFASNVFNIGDSEVTIKTWHPS